MDIRFTAYLLVFFVVIWMQYVNFQQNRSFSDMFQLSNSTNATTSTSNSRVSLFHASIFTSSKGLGIFRKTHLSYYKSKPMAISTQMLLLIIISGDVQLNPGPKYPCGMCTKNVNNNQKAMGCEQCSVWYHNKCTGMSDNLYRVFMEHESYVWICYRCGLPNLMDPTFFWTPNTSNPFDVLADIDSDLSNLSSDYATNAEWIGTPRHTSSPKKNQGTKTSRSKSHRVKRSMKFLNINFQSISNKIPSLHVLLEKENPDVIFGTETWLDGSVFSNELLPSTYQIFRKDRITTTTGGGVFLAIRSDLIAREEPDLSANCESIWASIHMKGSQAVYFGAFYRPDAGCKKTDLDYVYQLDQIMQKIPKTSHVWLAGDFNIPDVDWENVCFKTGGRYPAVSKQILEIALDYNLQQMVTQPTRGDNVLDLVFTNTPSFVQDVKILPRLGDHDIVLVDALLTPQRIKIPRRKVYLYKKGNFELINDDIQDFAKTLTDDNIAQSSVNKLWNDFKETVLTSIEKHIPSRLSKNSTQLPWVRSSHIRMIRRKQRLYNKARKSNHISDWDAFKDFRRSTDRSIRKARSDFLFEVGESLESGDSKPFWRFIKNTRQNFSGVAALNTLEGIAVSAIEKANALNEQFKSVFTSEDTSSIPTLPSDFPVMPPINITTPGVEKLLKDLKVQKAPGPDGLTPKVLKECASSIAPILTVIYQKSISTGELPEDWLQANVTPLFKKGNRSEPANYRPVSLTSIPCKLLEHIVHSNIMSHLEDHDFITDKQHGFRRGRSCETQLALTIDDLTRILNVKGQADVIIMDFSKAFDTVPHERLLAKLYHAGIHGSLHSWIRTFLTKRSQQVALDGAFSSSIHVTSGVPQGTVLGPLLFLLYLNDIADGVTSEVRLLADDCIMYRQIDSARDSEDLQKDIDRLCAWEERWQMKFNKAKCYAMHITHKKNPVRTSYQMGDSVLETVTNHTYLGVELNNKLSWASHIKNVTSRANQILGLLRRNLYSCTPDVKAVAYKTLVRPRLEYCASIWDPYQKDAKAQLEGVQRRSARFVMKNNKKKASVTEMLRNLEWEPLEHRRAAQRLILIYKSVNKLVAINTDSYQTKSREGVSTRSHTTTAFSKITANKDCYKFSLLPRTLAEWNCLPPDLRDAPTLAVFKSGIRSINLGDVISRAHFKN